MLRKKEDLFDVEVFRGLSERQDSDTRFIVFDDEEFLLRKALGVELPLLFFVPTPNRFNMVSKRLLLHEEGEVAVLWRRSTKGHHNVFSSRPRKWPVADKGLTTRSRECQLSAQCPRGGRAVV